MEIVISLISTGLFQFHEDVNHLRSFSEIFGENNSFRSLKAFQLNKIAHENKETDRIYIPNDFIDFKQIQCDDNNQFNSSISCIAIIYSV